MNEQERTHCRVDLHAARLGHSGLTHQQALGFWALKWGAKLDDFLLNAPEILENELNNEIYD